MINFIGGAGTSSIHDSSFCLAGTSAAVVKVLLQLRTQHYYFALEQIVLLRYLENVMFIEMFILCLGG